MYILLITIFLLLLLWILSIKGRNNFTDFKEFKRYYFAHRGLHSKGVPENSLLAFSRAKEMGYGAEFDVHLMSDGNLAVIHDHSLLRTAGEEVFIEDLEINQLNNYRLENTDEKIPTLKEVLNLFNGQVPLIIELKSKGNNISQLCSAVSKELENYNGIYCIESFDPRCVRWFKKNNPNVIRGQLSQNYFKSKNKKSPFILRCIMSLLITNFLTKPDFVAFKFKDRNFLSNKISTHLWKTQGVGWTITDMNDIKNANKENIISIFENIAP